MPIVLHALLMLFTSEPGVWHARRMPNPQPIWAGTIPCPECGGEPVVHRHTPNWARLTQMEVPFDFKVRPAPTPCHAPMHGQSEATRRLSQGSALLLAADIAAPMEIEASGKCRRPALSAKN